jgi:two-component system, OmpR family, KDP operon response regulator KdpE
VTVSVPKILVVDDEFPILKVIKSTLSSSGLEVITAATAAEALRTVAQTPPDAILLDLGLPDCDGKDVIVQVRQWTGAPIIVLSARHETDERIAALDLGANDYLTKPFHMGELQARLRAALRQVQRAHEAAPSYCGGGLGIDFRSRRVTILGEEVRLTRKEYELLSCLARHAGQVVSHKQLLAAGWGGAIADTQFVRVYVGQIRQKVEADPSAPALILTEPGIGYRLAAED